MSFPPTISPWPNRRFWTNLGDYLQLGNSTLGGAVCERLLPEDAIVHARASEYAEGGQVLSDVICWFGTDGYLSPSWLIPEFLALVACTLHVNFGSAPMEANKARRWMRWSQGGGGLEGTLESPLATPRGPDARAESWEERVLKEGMWLYAVEELMLRSSHFIALIFIFLLTCFSNFSDSQGLLFVLFYFFAIYYMAHEKELILGLGKKWRLEQRGGSAARPQALLLSPRSSLPHRQEVADRARVRVGRHSRRLRLPVAFRAGGVPRRMGARWDASRTWHLTCTAL